MGCGLWASGGSEGPSFKAITKPNDSELRFLKTGYRSRRTPITKNHFDDLFQLLNSEHRTRLLVLLRLCPLFSPAVREENILASSPSSLVASDYWLHPTLVLPERLQDIMLPFHRVACGPQGLPAGFPLQ